jgi:hypothetical protein
MNKKAWSFLAAAGVIVLVVAGVYGYIVWHTRSQSTSQPASQDAAFDPLNATYSIEGQAVALVNGKAETDAAPGSVAKIDTSIFDAAVTGDLDSDGRLDAAVILVQDLGGSGTFYSAAAAMNTEHGTQGTNAILLGDRIAPQTVEIKNGQIIVNYTDRKPGEPMTAAPSVGVSKSLSYDAGMLVAAN